MIRIYYTSVRKYASCATSLVILFVALLCSSQTAYAADINISCDATLCTPQFVPEFFSSFSTWYPGNTQSKTISITNKSKKKFPVTVEASSPQSTGDLDMVVQFTIASSNGATLWDGPLHSFYSYGPIDVSNNILPGKTQTYTFTGHMYESADDQYQGKTTTFNMTIGNYIYVPTTPVPCSSQTPVAPGWFNISRMSDSDVILYWGDVPAPYTGFTVSWGTDLNGSNSGSRNIGKTSEILISGLDLRRRIHYFKVRTVNECAVSAYSSVLAVGGASTPAPTQPIALSPTGFAPITPTPLPTFTTSPTASDGAVLGASTVMSDPADLIPLYVGVSTAVIFVNWIYSRLFM